MVTSKIRIKLIAYRRPLLGFLVGLGLVVNISSSILIDYIIIILINCDYSTFGSLGFFIALSLLFKSLVCFGVGIRRKRPLINRKLRMFTIPLICRLLIAPPEKAE